METGRTSGPSSRSKRYIQVGHRYWGYPPHTPRVWSAWQSALYQPLGTLAACMSSLFQRRLPVARSRARGQRRQPPARGTARAGRDKAKLACRESKASRRSGQPGLTRFFPSMPACIMVMASASQWAATPQDVGRRGGRAVSATFTTSFRLGCRFPASKAPCHSLASRPSPMVRIMGPLALCPDCPGRPLPARPAQPRLHPNQSKARLAEPMAPL